MNYMKFGSIILTTSIPMEPPKSLDYTATHSDAIVTCNASDMVLAAHSNPSYLSESNACNQAGQHFFMCSNTNTPPNIGAVMTISQIIKVLVISSAAG